MPFRVLSLLAFGLWLSGCASFPGKDLPADTYADLAPAPEAPEKKMCLVMTDTSTVSDEDREDSDATIAMLEKSGFFLKAPEHCTPSGEVIQNSIKWDFRNDEKAIYLASAFISGFLSGATLTIIPGHARDVFLLTIQLRTNDRLVKEYVYREHIDTWSIFPCSS